MPFQISARFFKNTRILSVFSIASLLLLTACGGGGGGGDDDGGSGGNPGVLGLSQHGSTNSHADERRGDNCLKSGCHAPGGAGTGIFITAGTAMSAIGGYIKYYAVDTGDLVASLEVDANGNFYTVTSIDEFIPNVPIGNNLYSIGTYVERVRAGNTTGPRMTGNISHEPTSAGCNNCHRNGGVKSPL